MHHDMERRASIQVRFTQSGVGSWQVCREEGTSYKTLQKMLTHPQPLGHRREAPYPEPRLGPFVHRIAEIPESDQGLLNKQRHTVCPANQDHLRQELSWTGMVGAIFWG